MFRVPSETHSWLKPLWGRKVFDTFHVLVSVYNSFRGGNTGFALGAGGLTQNMWQSQGAGPFLWMCPQGPVGPAVRDCQRGGISWAGCRGPSTSFLRWSWRGPRARAALEDSGEAFWPEEVTKKWAGAPEGPGNWEGPKAFIQVTKCPAWVTLMLWAPQAGGRPLPGSEASAPCLGEFLVVRTHREYCWPAWEGPWQRG